MSNPVILNRTLCHPVILNGTKWSEESHGNCKDDGILRLSPQNDTVLSFPPPIVAEDKLQRESSFA
jgi:hypothetical protein